MGTSFGRALAEEWRALPAPETDVEDPTGTLYRNAVADQLAALADAHFERETAKLRARISKLEAKCRDEHREFNIRHHYRQRALSMGRKYRAVCRAYAKHRLGSGLLERLVNDYLDSVTRLRARLARAEAASGRDARTLQQIADALPCMCKELIGKCPRCVALAALGKETT